SVATKRPGEPHESGDFKPANFREHVERLGGIRSVDIQRPFDDSDLCRQVPSPTPVPRPVTRSTGKPVMAATTADAGVVLPMPISPQAHRLQPSFASRATTSSPTPIAAWIDSTTWRALFTLPRAGILASSRSPPQPTPM